VLVARVVGGLALLAGLAATTYAVSHRPDRPLLLAPVQPAAAPAPPPEIRQPGTTTRAVPNRVSPAWVTTYAARTGIAAPALTAYADAALRAPCPVGWTTLAGIGWVESGNGTVYGSPLGADGRPVAPILGPVLDGRGRVAAVPDARGGWARAEGPMQFLPATWEQWESDGDRDGIVDPQDLDDAAYAAARYLCASGVDLGTGAGWTAAVLSYNHSDDYVRAVYDAATTYADRAS
jgi:membrane-bound lytic murein transglycosylase B